MEEAVDKEGSRVGQEEAVALLLVVEEETAEEVWAEWTELVVWVVLVVWGVHYFHFIKESRRELKKGG